MKKKCVLSFVVCSVLIFNSSFVTFASEINNENIEENIEVVEETPEVVEEVSEVMEDTPEVVEEIPEVVEETTEIENEVAVSDEIFLDSSEGSEEPSETMEEDFVDADDSDGIMLLIEYEANTAFKLNDGTIFYLPSEILNSFPYVWINSSSKAYFYSEFFYFKNAGNLVMIGKESSNDSSVSGYITVDLNGVKKGDYLTATIYESTGNMSLSSFKDGFCNHDLFDSDGSLISSIDGVIVESISFNISFSTGYDDITIESLTTDENGKLSELPTPTISPSGYTFGGWYLDSEYMNKVDEDFVYTASTTLYAKWDEVGIPSVDVNMEETNSLLALISAQLYFFCIVIVLIYVYKFFRIFF